jgi:hypothetical protein
MRERLKLPERNASNNSVEWDAVKMIETIVDTSRDGLQELYNIVIFQRSSIR